MFLDAPRPRALALVLATLAVAFAGPCETAEAQALAPPVDPGRRLEVALRHLDQMARILYVTAHPDDEDSGLLARLEFRDGVRVRLLTLTRGEGGQNEIGTDLFDALGVLRSRELEGSADWLGNEQRFSSAFEFGYSFSVEETYALWDEDQILRDIVREIRTFLPDVILTMQPDGDGGGQHHQASARLAANAFDIAATPQWPELGAPHVTRRLFHQLWQDDGGPIHVDIDLGVYDPVLGATYEEYGLRARESHRCQGMAQLHTPLTQDRSKWRWIRSAGGFDSRTRTTREDSPREVEDFTDGLPVRLRDRTDPLSLEILPRVAAARGAFASGDQELGRKRLEQLWTAMSNWKGDDRSPGMAQRRVDFGQLGTTVAEALSGAWGLTIQARSDRRYLAAGDSLHVGIYAASQYPLLLGATVTGPGLPYGLEGADPVELAPNTPVSLAIELRLDPGVAPTLPRPVPRPGERGEEMAGEFASPDWSAYYARPWVQLGNGARVQLEPVPIRHQEVDPDHPRVLLADVHVVPEPSVRPLLDRIPIPISADSTASVDCTWLVSSLEGGRVEVSLTLPEGWSARPTSRVVDLRPEIEVPVTFRLSGSRQGWAALREDPSGRKGSNLPKNLRRAINDLVSSVSGPSRAQDAPGEVSIGARIRHLRSGATSRLGYERVEYDHVRPGALAVPAECAVVPIPCLTAPDVRIGYVEGSGDEVLSAIERLGYRPTRLDETALLQGDLGEYDVIVTGVRAYKVRDDLAAAQPRLREWIEQGGVLLVQYNKYEFNAGEEESSPFAPYPNTLVGNRRVTVEESPVVVNRPGHAIFHRPNEIGPADWDGWVQERGLYFLDFQDDRYRDLLTLEDPWPYNGGPKGGSLVDAPVGQGHWVYIGVGLFRQLPAAVPGAYRLLANLIALGAKERP